MAEVARSTSYCAEDAPKPDRFFLLEKIPPLSEKRLVGVSAISMFLHGTDDKAAVKATYYLLETHGQYTIPAFKVGCQWCVRPSIVRAKWWSEESKGFSRTEELMVRVHCLLTRILPDLVRIYNGHLKQDEALQIAHAVDETVLTIEQLLRVKRA